MIVIETLNDAILTAKPFGTLRYTVLARPFDTRDALDSAGSHDTIYAALGHAEHLVEQGYEIRIFDSKEGCAIAKGGTA